MPKARRAEIIIATKYGGRFWKPLRGDIVPNDITTVGVHINDAISISRTITSFGIGGKRSRMELQIKKGQPLK